MSKQHRYTHYNRQISKLRKSIKTCKICSGESYIPTGKAVDDSTFEFEDCKCTKIYKKDKLYILANIPKRRYGILKEKKKHRKVLNIITNEKISLYKVVVKQYTKNFKKASKDGLGLMFFGTTGSSKTTSALYIATKLLKKGKDCYYIYFKDLINLLIQSYDDKTKAPLFHEIINVDLLIIDELSLVSRVTPHMVAEFTSICKQRFEDEKPTILISNYQIIDEIYHNFGSPMESLLMEAFIPFKFTGKDLREEKYEYLKKFFS